MALRSARLEALFGGRVASLTAQQLESLVSNGVTEAFDLDYKQTLYGRSDRDKRDLAGDVAALANTAGGLLILGVEEDDQARASATPGVQLSDEQEQRMRQVIASLVSPMPTVEVVSVVRDPVTSEGFYVLAVERTAAAPHAVLVNDGFRYPTRNGASIRYLSEPEVAEAYRARIAGLAEQNQRTAEVWVGGVGRLDVEDRVWVAIALVPGVRGRRLINQAEFRRFEQTIRGITPTVVNMGFSVMRTSVGLGYFSADGTGAYENPLSRHFRLELHADGSGFFAVDVGWRRGPTAGGADEALPPVIIDDEHLTVAVLSGLHRLAVHARDEAASSGGCAIRAGFHKMSPTQPALLGHPRGGGFDRTYSERLVAQTPPNVETSADLDTLADPSAGTVATAARICHQLGQCFGVAELGQLSSTGELRRPYWSHQIRPRLETWADAAGVAVTDEQLPNSGVAG